MNLLQVTPHILDSFGHASRHLSPDSLNNAQTQPFTSTALFSSLLSALIGAVVSLAVLMATIFYDRWKMKREQKNLMEKKLIYFAALVKPAIVYSEKQAQNIKDFALAIKENPLQFPLMTFAPKNTLEKIVDRIDEEPFFIAFTRHYSPYSSSVRTFKNITATIEYQNLQMNQVLEMAKESQGHDYDRKKKFQTSMKAATDLAANAIADDSMHQYPQLLELLDHHLVNFLTNRKDVSDLKYAHDAFVQPVMKGIVEKEFYKIPVGLTIANHLHDAAAVYSDILMQMESLREDFETIAEAYARSNKTLQDASSQFLTDFFENIQ